MQPVPEDDEYCPEAIYLGRHRSRMTPWQQVAYSIFVDAATCLRKDPTHFEYKKARQWIVTRNYGFDYWAAVLGADPDSLRRIFMKKLLPPEEMAKLKKKSLWFRRINSMSGQGHYTERKVS